MSGLERVLAGLRAVGFEIDAALEAARAEACEASAEAYERAMEADGIGKYQRERVHDAVTQTREER